MRTAPHPSIQWAPRLASLRHPRALRTTTAVVYAATGGSDVLTLVQRPCRRPGPGEVLVGVAVSGVNPTDWKARRGPGSVDRLQVPGQDGAGTILEVGADVEHRAVGERVWLWDVAHASPEGTTQQQVVVRADHAVPMGDRVSFDVGAALGIPALTAHRALTAGAEGPDRLSPGALSGRTVLVAGGAGAVGHAAVQLARWAGATVIATVSSPRKGRLASAAGAHHVVDYRRFDLKQTVRSLAPDGVDLVVEVDPASNLELDVALAAPGGTIAVYASDGPDLVSFPVRAAMLKNLRLQGVLTYTTSPAQKVAAVAAVARAADEGALGVGEASGLPLARFPIEETAAAHDLVESGFTGKVLVDVSTDRHGLPRRR